MYLNIHVFQNLFTVRVHNVSLIPNNKTLTIQENKQTEIRCEVNRNAAPPPTITWLLGSTDITSTAGINKPTIIIMGNRTNDNAVLKCLASNNNNKPLIATTELNIQCEFKLLVQIYILFIN